VEQQKEQYHFEIKGATCDEINRLSKPLQSRFRKLFLPRYTEEQFLDISEKVLSKTSPSIARYIAANVWKNGGDIRDCISIGKLIRKNDGPEEIAETIGTITKYGEQQFGSNNKIKVPRRNSYQINWKEGCSSIGEGIFSNIEISVTIVVQNILLNVV